MGQAGATLTGQAGGGTVNPGHTGPHPDDPTLPAPDPLHTLLNRCCYGIRLSDWNRGTALDYTGWLTDGTKFDSSIDRGQPAEFPLGGVIAGWTEGVGLMVEGEKRRLWIPEELAYKGRPGAPQGMLVFDVELIQIEAP